MYRKKQELAHLQIKVNQLYRIVKQLAEYIDWEGMENISLSDLEVNQCLETTPNHDKNLESINDGETALCDLVLSKHNHGLNNHKDILTDDEAMYAELSDYKGSDNIPCEEQVYRLTAQLTAAYHRIASLEDQLLAARSNEETRHNGFYHVQ